MNKNSNRKVVTLLIQYFEMRLKQIWHMHKGGV